MYSTKTMNFILGALALSTSAKAWKIQFYIDDSCANTDDYSDSVRSGKAGESLECDPLNSDLTTAVIKNWDDSCRLTIWGADEFIDCGVDLPGGEVVFNKTLSEARDDSTIVFNDKTHQACVRHLEYHRLKYISYDCS